MSSLRNPVPQPIDDFEGWLAAFSQPTVALELASLVLCVLLALFSSITLYRSL